MTPNAATRWAEFYDRDPDNISREDIPFYLKRAARFKGPVLDLACGTGRIAIPLANAGFHVTGLDHSPAMLAVLRKKRSTLPVNAGERITVEEDDMAHFDLGQEFSLIIIPSHSFQTITTLEKQRSCLACVQRHLTANGEFIITASPHARSIDSPRFRRMQLDWTNADPFTGTVLSRYSTQRVINHEKQILEISFNFELSRPRGIIDTFTESLKLACFNEKQLVELVEQAGFTVTERYGNYAGAPIDKGAEIILICRSRS